MKTMHEITIDPKRPDDEHMALHLVSFHGNLRIQFYEYIPFDGDEGEPPISGPMDDDICWVPRGDIAMPFESAKEVAEAILAIVGK